MLTDGLRNAPLKIWVPTQSLAGKRFSRRRPEERKCISTPTETFQPSSSDCLPPSGPRTSRENKLGASMMPCAKSASGDPRHHHKKKDIVATRSHWERVWAKNCCAAMARRDGCRSRCAVAGDRPGAPPVSGRLRPNCRRSRPKFLLMAHDPLRAGSFPSVMLPIAPIRGPSPG